MPSVPSFDHGPRSGPGRLYVWVWLPTRTAPVVAGALDQIGERTSFTYGRSYLARTDAISLYEPELPLKQGPTDPVAPLTAPSCIRDAGPDAWGQRVILANVTGRHLGTFDDTGNLSLLTYLRHSDSDRIGALDFQESPDRYLPRGEPATLQDMQSAAAALDEGRELAPELAAALQHGTSIGGARPKALLVDGSHSFIAKFSSSTDLYPVIKAEGVAMNLARRVGLDVADSQIIHCAGKDVLLVRRFDRPDSGGRRMFVSALTLLGAHELSARHLSYPELGDVIRQRFTDPEPTLHELFRRIVFNICVGNTDDHARNHGAFWDGSFLTLTPAYDLCPQNRSGTQANQAMFIDRGASKESRFAVCVGAARHYHLDPAEAQSIVDHQVDAIHKQWGDAADEARLTAHERDKLWGRQILNPYASC